jgi:membrane protein YdbS with pleckstrin-like domain
VRCNQCGREIANDASFCPYCGERLAAPIVPGGQGDPNVAPAPQPVVDPALAPHPSVATDRLQRETTRFGGKDPTEEELWSGTFSPKAMLGTIILIAAITLGSAIAVALVWNTGLGWAAVGIGAVILWGWLGLTVLYRRLSIHYRLTRFRLFFERGVVGRTIDRIETIDIDDVTVTQGPVERMLGIGTIIVASSDRTLPQLRMAGIDHVKAVADLIDSTRRAERQRRGLHLEST